MNVVKTKSITITSYDHDYDYDYEGRVVILILILIPFPVHGPNARSKTVVATHEPARMNAGFSRQKAHALADVSAG